MSRYFDKEDPPRLIWLQKHAKKRAEHEFGAQGMQEWLGVWRARKMAGEDVRVMLSQDESHMVAVVNGEWPEHTLL